ncbi:hypothetical protein BSL78_03994 [Apostichopus japonicus]|uniref:Reverse transcriptase domain-containing protein n=1 Tax=Stichopus japonicus TaxID=307972 RepID=A0A2G8LFV1_STIJA|nr:hypothetical protein BSL78_03994 [Apostichopus japonicus]
MCDVEKMFHRFHVSPEDRDYLRFLWYKGGDTKKEPLEYRMNVHLFGATSSPGCANFGMKHLSRMFEEEFSLAAPFLRQDFYVDDGVTSVKNAREAKELIKEACELCSKGNLRLHKFVSNDRSVIEDIPLSERATDVQDIDLSRDKLPVERTLGIHWNIEDDSFTFQIGLKERPDTRRGILSVVRAFMILWDSLRHLCWKGKPFCKGCVNRALHGMSQSLMNCVHGGRSGRVISLT